MTLNTVKTEILQRDSFLLIPHEEPDGDTLGSALGMAWALQFLGKKVQVFVPKPPSPMYRWMESLYGGFVVNNHQQLDPFQLIIVVDCGSTQLINGSLPFLSRVPVINIDHHADNGRYGQINWIDPEYASTTMMVFDLIRALGVPLSKEMGTALYTGLTTDTGNFAFSNTNAKVFEMAYQCVQAGVVPYSIYHQLYEMRPASSLKLLGLALSRIETNSAKNIGWIVVDQGMLKEAEARPEETEGIINYLRMLDSLKIALVFRQNDTGRIKVSLRSKSAADVNRVAKEFQGGGHPKAAGCTLELEMTEAVRQVVLAAERELNRCGEVS